MNKLEIIKHEIDWLKLIEMAFKKQDWGKTYNLYVSGDFKITCTMRLFNFEKNYATFNIECVFPESDCIFYSWEKCKNVEYYLDNYTIDDFKLLIKRSCLSLLYSLSDIHLSKKSNDLYSDLKYHYNDIDDDLIIEEGYEEELDEINNISNDNIRNAAYNELESTVYNIVNEEFNRKVNSYIRNNKSDINGLNELIEEIKNE